MRGKLRTALSDQRYLGLIPAHAGKTRGHNRAHAQGRAHPRACGENALPSRMTRLRSGSSPRMRGKHAGVNAREVGCGLIPAHAGKTHIHVSEHCANAAHPRACGENFPKVWMMLLMMGSSPRMRGKLAAPILDILDVRLIPAHAGKTILRSFDWDEKWAHPRACGEN